MKKMLKIIATNAVLFLLLVSVGLPISMHFEKNGLGSLVLALVAVHLVVVLVVAIWHFTQRDFYLGRAYLFSILLLLAFTLILGAIAYIGVLSALPKHD